MGFLRSKVVHPIQKLVLYPNSIMYGKEKYNYDIQFNTLFKEIKLITIIKFKQIMNTKIFYTEASLMY